MRHHRCTYYVYFDESSHMLLVLLTLHTHIANVTEMSLIFGADF